MTDSTRKPARRLELHIDTNAAPADVWEALTTGQGISRWFAPTVETQGQGEGSSVTFAWSEEMKWTSRVDTWEPGQKVRWFDEGALGEGTALAAEWTIETSAGRTRITLVQSGFGEAAWDDLFDGTKVGWTYFLYNLRLCLERHPGKPRHLISRRFSVSLARPEVWARLVAPSSPLLAGATDALAPGATVFLRLGEDTTAAVVELVIPGRLLALRLPALDDSALMVELEGGKDSFSIGNYLSVYDEALAARVGAKVLATVERLQHTLR